jgi:hypothetical protein
MAPPEFKQAHVIMASPDSSLASLIKQTRFLKTLASVLPNTVRLATETDIIHQVFTRCPVPQNGASGEQHWQTFNRRLDILFGENVRNSDGCLQHIMQGPFGMDMVIRYIEKATATGELLVDAAMPKIERLVKELQFLTYLAILLLC